MDLTIEGEYTLNNDVLTNKKTTLKVGTRWRVKKGQAKRFIGYLDLSKPEPEQYQYISSLYSSQGKKNSYRLEYGKQQYDLNLTGLNKVVITRSLQEPPLVFDNSEEKGGTHELIK